jgi:hypothetical protein
MADEKNESSGFKVVDRRAFSGDGERHEEEAPKTVKAESPAPVAEKSARPQVAESHLVDASGHEIGGEPSGFETLVSYLSTTTMFQLGLLAGPGGERIPPDMTNAQRTIDLLAVLQEKTRGNLNADESRLLDDVLYELRMTFLELQKRMARKV